jgi:hypothetical protein
LSTAALPPRQWTRPTGWAVESVADSGGDLYITGTFGATTDFGDTSLTAAGYGDVFVAKYDSTGATAWVRSAGYPTTGSIINIGRGVVTDGSDGCYAAGEFRDTISFDGVESKRR